MNQPQSLALLFPEIKELLNAQNFALLKQVLRECDVIGFTDVWRRFNEEERLQIFRLLPTNAALRLFEVLEVEDQKYLLNKLNEESVAPILENLHSPDLAKIFHKMSPRAVKKMTGLIQRQEALAHIDKVMQYPEKTAGSLMHPEFVKLTPKNTARQGLSILSAIARPHHKKHLMDSLFVTDDEGRLLGTLHLHDLFRAPEDEKLSEIMESAEAIKLAPETDQEEVSKVFSKYQVPVAPVVDAAGKLLGVIEVGDIISVVRQEATEDIAKMAGTKAVDVKETSILKTVWYRLPWLVVTMFGGLAISLVIKAFEPTLAKIIALASFSPLIAGMGGNVGSQSATIMVRSIALGQINGHRKAKAVMREVSVGVLLGVVYGILLGAIAYAIYGEQYHLYFSIVVAVGMFTSMTVAATMGALEPLVFHRLGIDPATATGPLITTTTDIISNLTYFSLATALLL